MSRIDTVVCTDARKTKYRFVVLTMIFLVYAINYADRTNIGAVLPFIIDEFHINNFEAGAIASMFFFGLCGKSDPGRILYCQTRYPGVGFAIHFRLFRFYLADGHRELRFWSENGASGTGS